MIPEKIARYRIVRKLGAGGMGEVYRADDPSLGRQVAIKVLPATLAADETARIRLVQEAQPAAKLDHPNVCAIYEVGEDEGHVFVAMQYIDGETLAQRMRRGPLGVGETLDLVEQAAGALAEAHARGLIHRDVKPQNIMITARAVWPRSSTSGLRSSSRTHCAKPPARKPSSSSRSRERSSAPLRTCRPSSCAASD